VVEVLEVVEEDSVVGRQEGVSVGDSGEAPHGADTAPEGDFSVIYCI